MSEVESADEHGLVGRLLQDRYRVKAALGRGGMATVYLAFDQNLGREVVVKIPRLDALGDDATRRRFLAEVRDHSRHEHPHILGILDHGLCDGIPFAVLQYLRGGDLGGRLRAGGGTCSTRDILAWLRPVAEALDFIHERGCLHRDVKPGNILFDERGHPFLSDFGISTALDVIDAEAPTVAPKDRLTTAGTFVGSPAYAPPEAIDRVFTPSYDQYALATVVYLGLAGALPFDGRTNEAILIAKARSDPAPLRSGERARRIPPACEKVIRRALSRQPEARYPTCTAFAEAFESAVQAERGRSAAVRFAAGVALAALAAVGVWQWTRGAGSATDDAVRPPVAVATGEVVLLGSAPDELADALALCQAHADACDADEFDGETLHEYRVAPVALDAYEVTNEGFAQFVDETGLVTQAERDGYGWDGPTRRYGASWRQPGGDVDALRDTRLPVVHVTLGEARRYCAARGARLPTADEWELTARGDARRVFPWGDDWDPSRLRFDLSTRFGLEPVGSHPRGATPEGVHDLAGSVWEWTETAGADGHVIKGGSWDARNPAYFRAAAFSRIDPDTSGSDIGFRCARDVP